MSTQSPMTNDQINAIRTRLATPNLSTDELREIATTLLADNTAQYTEADYWREGYRLAKGLSHDEIGAIIAVRDASKAHPRPCWFPHEPCMCTEEEESEDEGEHEECLGIHNSADGYRDCDGNPI